MLPALPLLACLLLASPAQDEPGSPPKARATVLHLANGAVLRAQARENAAGSGQWQVLVRGEWQELPAGSVLHARAEYELLSEAKALERGLPKGDLVRRVAYADWLVNAGLRIEALKELDRVLGEDPDQADALALLQRAPLSLGLPPVPGADGRGLDAYFAGAARLTGAGQELAVNALARADEIAGLRTALGQELVQRTSARRAFATLALRRLFAGSEAQGLLSRAILDSSREVRTGAALALKAFDDPAVIVPALRAIGSKQPEVRVNAVEALTRMEYREAVEPLFHHLVSLQGGGGGGAPHTHIYNGKQVAYVQDFDVEVAQGQAIADPIINILQEGSVLDVAVIGATEYQLAGERASVRRALAKLTGANPGDTTVAWQRWWDEHGGDWRAGAAPPKTPTTPAGQG
ncbi:MAG: hypothetical protein EXS08_17125 [Planctomycetes bacterium]|nr:hypothetical protein [Planctomycetota bacterium]